MDIMGFITGKKKDIISLAIDEALELLAENNFDQAIAVIREKALSRNPEHRRALLHLAICYMLKGDFDPAEELLKPLAANSRLDSESAAALIALDKIAADRKKLAKQK